MILSLTYKAAGTKLGESLSIKTFLVNDTASIQVANLVKTQKGRYKALSVNKTVSIGQSVIGLISAEPPVLQFNISDQTWLLLGQSNTPSYLQNQQLNSTPQVLLWSGESLSEDLLEVLQPQVAIAASSKIDANIMQQLRQGQVQVYWTGRDGAIGWSPRGGFETTLDRLDTEAPL